MSTTKTKPATAPTTDDAALPRPAKSADLDDLRQRLGALGLSFAAEFLADLLTRSVKEDQSTPAFLARLLESEQSSREERRVRTALRLSGLPMGQTISNFDFAFQPAIERSRIDALATCSWLKEKQSLLILGPPGVGKTHLAVALGVRAVECGFSVAYYRVEELLHAMRKDGAQPPARLKRAKYMKAALLIVDEMGFEPFSREEATLLFRLVSYRYGRGSMCITSNKAIAEWAEMLAGDEVITAAILDRLLHASCVLNIKGRSYRLRDLEEGLRTRR
jgi:DNA replication protein DnaC